MHQILFSKDAKKDFIAAYNWYESIRKGLGAEFELSIDASVLYIARNPSIFQKRYKTIRICFIDRFPYGIHFLIDKKIVRILAIFHTNKNPTNWDKV
ncbi:MAG: type II toxin-antitoxin system RelE/ParE family toxin [Flavobacteriales bacterium]|nr:type II toxin-antitoxin system RelE/ParE family toxin [Flavobacteriales bacterium]MCB9364783.1 type II toxin-antitoxin system RelE/ParE family toxin [Flavobacteriales bacterium]